MKKQKKLDGILGVCYPVGCKVGFQGYDGVRLRGLFWTEQALREYIENHAPQYLAKKPLTNANKFVIVKASGKDAKQAIKVRPMRPRKVVRKIEALRKV